MPGLDVSRFDSKVEEDFICSICLGVLLNPVQDKCEHLFCNDCIKEWLEKSDSHSLRGNCPLSQEIIGWFELKPVSRIVRNLLANLSVNCKFRENGCSKSIRYDQLDEHERDCEYQLCSKGCGAVLMNQSDDHDCIVYLKSIIDTQMENIQVLQDICALNQREIQEKTDQFNKLLTILDTTAPKINQKVTEMEGYLSRVRGEDSD
ncbi:E3 ubiquitin-protein ligase NRDP1-like isoform X2 [Brevipalpus obovatus]|uniref:E3 ubiquitin-protein ligase NRDP1-like isoform X2 n=1 Tax=Brevipalpus obovatus TaxID=246614 RepID=UPI003D9E1A65